MTLHPTEWWILLCGLGPGRDALPAVVAACPLAVSMFVLCLSSVHLFCACALSFVGVVQGLHVILFSAHSPCMACAQCVSASRTRLPAVLTEVSLCLALVGAVQVLDAALLVSQFFALLEHSVL